MSVYDRVSRSITGRNTYIESEDSDYNPNEDEPQHAKKRRLIPKRSKERKKLHRTVRKQTSMLPTKKCNNTADKLSLNGNMAEEKWAILPAEILSKIFGYVVIVEGSALPVLNNLKRVCKHWGYVANIPHLLTHMSFSPVLIKDQRQFLKRFEKFQDIAHKFYYTHTFTYASLHTLAAKIINVTVHNSKSIQDISVTDCPIRDPLSMLIERHNTSLRHVSLKRSSMTQGSWKKFLNGLGDSMKTLEIVGFEERYRPDAFSGYSMNHLKNLTDLKLQLILNFKVSFIKDLKKLKILHLKDMDIGVNVDDEFYHPNLEEVDLSCELIKSSRHFLLFGKLSNCPKIQRLCVRGRYIDIDTLCTCLRHCSRIHHLDISVTKSDQNHNTIGSLIHIIGPTLKELHIDKYVDLEESLKKGNEFRNEWNHLEILSMQATDIQGHTLLSYLKHSFTNMKILNIGGCRTLPRGCKRDWTDLNALKKILQRSLKEI